MESLDPYDPNSVSVQAFSQRFPFAAHRGRGPVLIEKSREVIAATLSVVMVARPTNSSISQVEVTQEP